MKKCAFFAGVLLIVGCTGGETAGIFFDDLQGGLDTADGAGGADLASEVERVADVVDVAPEDLPFDFGGMEVDGSGGELQPCSGPADCPSGFCIQTMDGKVCTESCIEDCPEGFECVLHEASLPDEVYICAPPWVSQCRPCTVNSECFANSVDLGEACVQYGASGNFCGSPCELDDDCPDGHVCQTAADVTGGEALRCVLAEGECPCTKWFADDGAGTDCFVENEFGLCGGQRQCMAEGLTACSAAVPAAESCNGLDDDCDGDIDEETDGDECFVQNVYGVCPGTTDCVDGEVLCDGPEAKPESCDGEDNDCDGIVDEGFEDTDKDGIADCMENDKDGDGISDAQDNCPADFNPGQLDSDFDNFGDACDADDDNDKSPDDEDCAPLQGDIYPGADEVCDGLDNDCNLLVDEGFVDTDADSWKDCVDEDDDNDGTPDEDDCAPLDKFQSPTMEEWCDGIDNNCNGQVDEGFPDTDGDGIPDCAGDEDKDGDDWPDVLDCAPLDHDIHPDAAELCDGIDNNCNSAVDEGFSDTDADGLKNCVDGDDDNDGDPDETDCGPLDATVHQGAMEVCDGQDNNCNGETDEGFGFIGCGKGECAHEVPACLDGVPQTCDPYQGIELESCDGKDNDCDGLVDEDLGFASCGKGACLHVVANCTDGQPTECDPLTGAVDEVCDGEDNDCDGKTDEGLGTVACGKGQCFHTVPACLGGVEQECSPFDGAGQEVCDGVDNDCDGDTDEDLGAVSCGKGNCAHEQPYCVDGKIIPCDPFEGVAQEVCDSEDNDCDGLTDEDIAPVICGIGVCLHSQTACIDGQPNECDPFLGQEEEVCDGQDNDCDGSVDEELGDTVCGLGECEHTVANCLGGQTQVCDPLEGAVEEACDALDNDCDGEVDEDFVDTDADGEADCVDLDDDNDGDPDETDCAPLDAAIGHTLDEACYNGVDDDCDESTVDACIFDSCKTLLAAVEGIGDGTYPIDPDGADGPIEPFEVYCDMTLDGGGWTGFTPAQAKDLLGGTMVAVDAANTAGIDNEGRPYTQDQSGGHTYHYTFDVPFGFSEIAFKDYQAKAYAGGSYTSDLAEGTTFTMTTWSKGYLAGGWGDIGFGAASQTGPVVSFAKELTQYVSCTNCIIDWPAPDKTYSLGEEVTQYRIGWGEDGGQYEGWYPWWSGMLLVR